MSTVIPTLKYDDAHAAIEFLCDALGFERHALHQSESGKVAHAELRHGDGIVMVGDRSEGDARFSPGTSMVYLAVPDVDALYERARSNGASVLMEPTDQDYGSRDFVVADPEGNIWAFGTYAPELSSTERRQEG